jgi:rhodanese-related sulfurtransferase
VAQQLRDQGYPSSYALRGGFDAWKEAGGPTEQK